MFGKQGRFEKKLARGEAGRAPATILRVSKLLPGSSDAAAGTYRAHVRVEPLGRAGVRGLADHARHRRLVRSRASVRQIPPSIYHEAGSVAWDSDEARAEFRPRSRTPKEPLLNGS